VAFNAKQFLGAFFVVFIVAGFGYARDVEFWFLWDVIDG